MLYVVRFSIKYAFFACVFTVTIGLQAFELEEDHFVVMSSGDLLVWKTSDKFKINEDFSFAQLPHYQLVPCSKKPCDAKALKNGATQFADFKTAQGSVRVYYDDLGNIVGLSSDLDSDGIFDSVDVDQDNDSILDRYDTEISLAGVQEKRSDFVATVPGDFSVTQLGDASYSIPIAVPAGVNGLRPQTSLRYNSAKGNGMVGVGWDFQATSVVARCGSSLIQDGVSLGVTMSHLDHFCLNGQRLRRIQGSKTEYRTEIDSFSRIIAKGRIINGAPDYFVVWKKTGERLTYGQSSNARQSIDGVTNRWYLQSVHGVYENEMSYQYTHYKGQPRLDRINYAGGSLRLTYESRADKKMSWLHGVKVERDQRLSKILVHDISQSQAVREYHLQYAPIRESRLTSVRLCANDQCLPAKQFVWNTQQDSIKTTEAFYPKETKTLAQHETEIKKWKKDLGRIKTGDFNADGIADLYVSRTNVADDVYYGTRSGQFKKSTASGRPATGDQPLVITDLNGDGRGDVLTAGKSYHIRADGTFYPREGEGFLSESIRLGQFDGDGIGDQFFVQDLSQEGQDQWRISSSSLNANFSLSESYQTVASNTSTNINCERLKTSMYNSHRHGSLSYYFLPNGTCMNHHVTKLADINGDGLDDVVVFAKKAKKVYSYINSSGGSMLVPNVNIQQLNHFPVQPTEQGLSAEIQVLLTGDFNGDGSSDFLIEHGKHNHYEILFSKGNGTYESKKFSDTVFKHNLGLRYSVHDFNGDGISDVYVKQGWDSATTDTVLLGNGDGSFTSHKGAHTWIGDSWNDFERFRFGDFNGDGYTDVYYNNQNGQDNVFYFSAQTKARIKQFITRLGTTDARLIGENVELEYRLLTDDFVEPYSKLPFYQLDTRNFNDDRSRRFAKPLVYEVTKNNYHDLERTVRYTYDQHRSNRLGRGTKGFSAINKVDVSRGALSRTYYEQDYPFIGLKKYYQRSQIRYKGGQPYFQLIEKTSLVHESAQLKAFDGVIEQPRLLSKRSWYYDALRATPQDIHKHASPGGPAMIYDTMEYKYSSSNYYGVPDQINHKIQSHSGLDRREVVKDYTYKHIINTNHWRLGLVDTLTETVKRHGVEDQVVSEENGYSSHGLLMSKRVYSPQNTFLSKEVGFGRDAKANIVRQTVTAYDPVLKKNTQRETRTYYDDLGRYPTSVRNAKYQTTTLKYHPICGQPFLAIDPNGNHTYSEYDVFCNLVEVKRSDGTSTQLVKRWLNDGDEVPTKVKRHAYYKQTRRISGQPDFTTYFNQLGQPLLETTTSFTGDMIYTETRYDSLGRKIKVSRPHFDYEEPRWIINRYDVLDRLVEQTLPSKDGQKSHRFSYDGLTMTEWNAENQKTIKHKDALGNIIRVEQPLGSVLLHKYNPHNNVIESNANGVVHRYDYDELGQKIVEHHPSLGEIKMTYNGFGEMVEMVDAKQQKTQIFYDSLGRKTKVVQPEGSSEWQYDAATNGLGKLNRVSLFNGNSEEYEYDQLGRLARLTRHIDAKPYATDYRYDALGRLRSTRYANDFEVLNEYNRYGYMTAKKSPRSLMESNNAQHLTQEFLASISKVSKLQLKVDEHKALANYYELKAQDYLSVIDKPDISVELRQRLQATIDNLFVENKKQVTEIREMQEALFFAVGLLDTALASGSSSDSIKKYIKQMQDYISDLKQESERLRSMVQDTEVVANETVSVEIQSMLDDFAYLTFWKLTRKDPEGRPEKLLYGNGIMNTRQYDRDTGQLNTVHSERASGERLRHLDYVYDNENNLLSRIDQVQDIHESFQYDPLQRITQSIATFDANNVQATFFDYDITGNILSKTTDVEWAGYRYALPNNPYAVTQLDTTGIDNTSKADTYQYDANGNMLSGKGRTINWTSNNKPVTIVQSDQTVDFIYGAEWQRYKMIETKNADTKTTYYLHDDHERLVENGVITDKHYINAGGRAVAIYSRQNESGQISDAVDYFHHDALGSIDTITDDHAQVIARNQYDVFGDKRRSPIESDVLEYHWDFGDGEQGQGQMKSHVYATPGQYTASLRVVSKQGLVGSMQRNITVNELAAKNPTSSPNNQCENLLNWQSNGNADVVQMDDCAFTVTHGGEDWSFVSHQIPELEVGDTVSVSVTAKASVDGSRITINPWQLAKTQGGHITLSTNSQTIERTYVHEGDSALTNGDIHIWFADPKAPGVGQVITIEQLEIKITRQDGSVIDLRGNDRSANNSVLDLTCQDLSTWVVNAKTQITERGDCAYQVTHSGEDWSFLKLDIPVMNIGDQLIVAMNGKSSVAGGGIRVAPWELASTAGGHLTLDTQTKMVEKTYVHTELSALTTGNLRIWFADPKASGADQIIDIESLTVKIKRQNGDVELVNSRSHVNTNQQYQVLMNANIEGHSTLSIPESSRVTFLADNWVSSQTDNNALITKRGFTGHEHFDAIDVVHMKGRMYDPVLSRFMSPDIILQAPYNAQNYNRYSYVFNNPLKYTDPSGWAAEQEESSSILSSIASFFSSLFGGGSADNDPQSSIGDSNGSSSSGGSEANKSSTDTPSDQKSNIDIEYVQNEKGGLELKHDENFNLDWFAEKARELAGKHGTKVGDKVVVDAEQFVEILKDIDKQKAPDREKLTNNQKMFLHDTLLAHRPSIRTGMRGRYDYPIEFSEAGIKKDQIDSLVASQTHWHTHVPFNDGYHAAEAYSGKSMSDLSDQIDEKESGFFGIRANPGDAAASKASMQNLQEAKEANFDFGVYTESWERHHVER